MSNKEEGFVTLDDNFWFEHAKPTPWYHNTYYAVWRFFIGGRGNPVEWCRRIRNFCQRGWRGWSDRDMWSLDYYLSSWVPNALRHLKNIPHQTPNSMYPDDMDYSNLTQEIQEVAQKKWDAILDKIIAGFEANVRLTNRDYENELGAIESWYPVRSGESQAEWEARRRAHYIEQEKLEARDTLLFQEGLALFCKHFQDFCD